MLNHEQEEKIISELMKHSAEEMPFADFEDRMMNRIHEETSRSGSFLKQVKLSWFFFIIGTGFGLLLSMIASQSNVLIYGIPIQRFVLLAQIIFAILLLTQFDKLLQLTRKKDSDR